MKVTLTLGAAGGEVLYALYLRNRRWIARDASSGRDPLAVLHGLQAGKVVLRWDVGRTCWRDRDEVLVDGGGDADELACAVAAELDEAGARLDALGAES